jgi:hypothetical protein
MITDLTHYPMEIGLSEVIKIEDVKGDYLD